MKKNLNQLGYGIAEIILIIVALSIVAGTGFYVYKQNQNDINIPESNFTRQEKTSEDTEMPKDANEGYLAVQEWGLRFKIPENLTDVQYKISGDTLGIFAKPIEDENGEAFDVEYTNNYDEVNEHGNFAHSLGQLIRSKDSSKNVVGQSQKGKKLGDYYYYTAHSFSSLATGAGSNGIFLDQDCLNDDLLEKCERYYLAESIVFAIVNGTSLHPETDSEVDDALLPSIEVM